jgi:hypothetical protein
MARREKRRGGADHGGDGYSDNGPQQVGGYDHVVDAIRYATTNVLSDDEPDPDGGVLRLELW